MLLITYVNNINYINCFNNIYANYVHKLNYRLINYPNLIKKTIQKYLPEGALKNRETSRAEERSF